MTSTTMNAVGLTHDTDAIDLANVARTIKHGWRVVIAFTVLGIVIAAAVILFVPPKFAGTATIVLKSANDASNSALAKLGGLGDATSGLIGGSLKSPMETEIEVLDSRALAGEVVDSLRLQARILSPRGTAPSHIISSLRLPAAFKPHRYHFQRQGAAYRITGAATPSAASPGAPVTLPEGSMTLVSTATLPTSFDIELLDREDAITRLKKHLVVDKAGGEVARIDYRGDDSLTAAAVPNALVAVYLARRRTTDRGVNQRRVDFLTVKLDSANNQLAAAESQLRRERQATGIFDPGMTGKLDLDEFASLRGRLTDLEVEQGALSLLMTQVGKGSINPRQLAAFPTFLKSPAINDLITQLSQVETQRYEALGGRTAQDPSVQALDQSAHNIEGQLLPIAKTYAASIAKQRADLEQQLDTLNTSLAVLPQNAEINGRLQRDVVQLSQIYGAMQAQLVDATLAAIGEGGEAQPLDVAVPQKKPAFPAPLPTMAIGVVGGLCLGLVAALLVGMLGGWLQDPESVERAVGVPALRFDPSVPLFVGGATAHTVLVAPVDQAIPVDPVIRRLVATATSRSVTTAVLDLSNGAVLNVDSTIARLEAENGLVVVKLPLLSSDAAGAAIRPERPLLLVTAARRVARDRLVAAVQMLRRLNVPCAGVVMTDPGQNGTLV